jgi:hypothetical protein
MSDAAYQFLYLSCHMGACGSAFFDGVNWLLLNGRYPEHRIVHVIMNQN